MMNNPESASRDPEAEYKRRIDALRVALVPLKRRDAVLGYSKLSLLVLGTVVVIWIITSKYISTYWVLAPFALFIFLEVLHERVKRAIDRNTRATRFYERGIARINDRWAGTGETGERFASNSHPYARDLDLFGNGSLFQLLCDARTKIGEEALANWLLAPAAPEEVDARQAAVADLRDRIDLREDLALLGASLQVGIAPEALGHWAEAPPVVASAMSRIAAAILSAAWLAGFLAWCASFVAWVIEGSFVGQRLFVDLLRVLLLVTVVNVAFGRAYRRWMELACHIEPACKGLSLLASIMARFEKEQFSSPKLIDLQSRMRAEGEKSSKLIARLSRLAELLQSRRGVFIDRLVFYTLQIVFAMEAWHKKYGASVRGWISVIGELEALSSLAAYAYEHPGDVFPEFSAEAPCFEAEDFTHPLIPVSRAIRNDICLRRDLRLMIISGPNMAGKSTFVRAVGINAVLAQCGAPVRARRLLLSPLSVAASVCVLDSLQGGISRFYAEILRIKLTLDLADGPTPVLFLLDEFLGGTNSNDRRVGAESIVRNLLARGAIGMITTHDLALAEIADSLGRAAGNFHFEDRVEDGRLRFDYRLSAGVVRTSKALQLMRFIGIDV